MGVIYPALSRKLFGKKHFPKDEGEMAFIKSLHPVGLYHFLQSGDDAKKFWTSSAPGPGPSSLLCIFHTTKVIFPLYEMSVHFFLSFVRRRVCSFVSLLCMFLSLIFLGTRALL